MKKGFTLVEIILSIALITVVGVGSIIGFITYKNYTKEKTLNEMDSEILTALRLYMETNEEIKSKVYEEKEGLAVSLQTLQNEGLIDFGNLDITDEDDYVVAFLTAENDCSDISTLKGWDFQDGKPLYICTNSSGGQNLFQVAGDADNLSYVTREPYIFKYSTSRNYLKYNDTLYRIMYIDTDDSLAIYSTTAFTAFTESQILPIAVWTTDPTSHTINCNSGSNIAKDTLYPGDISNNNTSGSPATIDDIYITGAVTCTSGFRRNIGVTSYIKTNITNLRNYTQENGTTISYYYQTATITVSGYKIRLKPCMEIISGTGSYATPYILKNNCPST